jgi:hypothetical protein
VSLPLFEADARAAQGVWPFRAIAVMRPDLALGHPKPANGPRARDIEAVLPGRRQFTSAISVT